MRKQRTQEEALEHIKNGWFVADYGVEPYDDNHGGPAVYLDLIANTRLQDGKVLLIIVEIEKSEASKAFVTAITEMATNQWQDFLARSLADSLDRISGLRDE
jgi:hypothetical protein